MQTGFERRVGHQLPDSRRAIAGRGDRGVVAFQIGQESELTGQPVFRQLVDHQQQVRHGVGERGGEFTRTLRIHARPVLDRGVVVATGQLEARPQPWPGRFDGRRRRDGHLGFWCRRYSDGFDRGDRRRRRGLGARCIAGASRQQQAGATERRATTAEHRKTQVARSACGNGFRRLHACGPPVGVTGESDLTP